MTTEKKAPHQDHPELRLPRRRVLRGGLAGFASIMMAPLLPGCDESAMGTDAGGRDSGLGSDAALGVDAGIVEFPIRNIPPGPSLRSLIGDIGALGDPDANSIRLPPGFTSRVIAHSGEAVTGSTYVWHQSPDGGATFRTEEGGWIYVSNSEMPLIGGAGAVRFDATGNIVDAYPILQGTSGNCAGGKTPWHTWISCEENNVGLAYECDPWGDTPAVARPALGVFKHEAVTFDPVNSHFYLTEDVPDGAFYRFVPERLNAHGNPDLTSGELQVASVDLAGVVTWHTVPDPTYEGSTPTRSQVSAVTPFNGGEGVWHHNGVVYFTTKGDTRVWEYTVATSELAVLYDGEALSSPPLTGVDNVTVSCCGDVLVAEDGGSMQIVAIRPTGEILPLMQVVGQDGSEITGPAFDPSGTRLYFSSQRGTTGAGYTFEITGPFHEEV